MKKTLKVSFASLMAVVVLVTAAMALRVYDHSAAHAKKEVKQTERRVLPVLVFSSVQLVWKIFASDKE